MNETLSILGILIFFAGVFLASAQANGQQWQRMAEEVTSHAQRAATGLSGPLEIRTRNLTGTLEGGRSDWKPDVKVTELKLDGRRVYAKVDVLVPVQVRGGTVSPTSKFVAEGSVTV